MEQDERAHIQTFADMVEIIAARIEADLSHVAGTYCSPTAISARKRKDNLYRLSLIAGTVPLAPTPHMDQDIS
jgi:hypothetical protein